MDEMGIGEFASCSRLSARALRIYASRQPDSDRFRKDRQLVEHRIAPLMQLGLRQARCRHRPKSLFQVLMTAAVANLTLLAGRLDPSRPPPQPRGVGREQPATSLAGIQAPTPTALEPLAATGPNSTDTQPTWSDLG